MTGVAFYAPMKPPTDPIPSGDRTMARALMAALSGIGLGAVRLISELRSRDGRGEAARQDEIFHAAEAEKERLAKTDPPALWLTYHSYYKAPDLLGPALSRHWGIPYVLVEATRAAKRLGGPHARFAAAAEAACDTADVIFYMTERDREALERDRPPGQRLIRLRPFLNREALGATANRHANGGPVRFLACAMFRDGDKLASYKALAAALALVRTEGWTLTIVGDGPARAEVETLFSAFGERVRFLGALAPEQLAGHFAGADALLWPGVGEAYGMVYLEAQAQSCPVVAEDRPGVRDVVRDGGWLAAPEDPPAFARAIETLITDNEARLAAGRKARAQIAADHLLDTARTSLKAGLEPLFGRQGR
ncbi:MAG TPA: glycosyltransferase family 4 protein [Afifellaceae bacterium]|nr:glycosyltransferase family 4 protein [Afifellaceae bacterium]